MFACPCCQHLTLQEEPPGSYLVCPVCFWEDDPVQVADTSYKGGANAVSLREARDNYLRFGASEERFAGRVRQPTPDERHSDGADGSD